jgi:hypothetical protein
MKCIHMLKGGVMGLKTNEVHVAWSLSERIRKPLLYPCELRGQWVDNFTLRMRFPAAPL